MTSSLFLAFSSSISRSAISNPCSIFLPFACARFLTYASYFENECTSKNNCNYTITHFCIIGIIYDCLNSCFLTVLHLSDLSEQLRGAGKAVIDYVRPDYRSFSYWEFDVKRYINSQPDKEETADLVLNASLPFLIADECKRVKGQLSYIVNDMKNECLQSRSRGFYI